MTRGIYIITNDKVLEQAIACLNSIRCYDPDIPIVLIPYDNRYQAAADYLGHHHGVSLYPDLDFIQRLSENLQQIFGAEFFARPNQFRKQACWFGPFDRFLYIDVDLVVFSEIARVLDHLNNYDFLCYDYQHRGGLRNLFAPQILEAGVFSEAELQETFNGGFWASKKGLLSESDLYDSFRECAAHPDYFDFSEKTSDQPIINYMILKRLSQRLNLVNREGGAPGSWAGTRHFQQDGLRLIDPNVNQPLDYLHWAGIRIQPGCPYWDIWAHYRYLHDPESRPPDSEPPQEPPLKTWARKLKQQLQ